MIIDYSKESIIKISSALTNDCNACIPTDTVYGLVARASSDKAIQNIFELKKRNLKSPLAMLCASIDQAKKYIITSELFEKLSILWPGALTLICRQNLDNKFKLATSGLGTIGVRIPNSETVSQIIELTGEPIFATSVNISGNKPIQDPNEMNSLFENKILILKSNLPQQNHTPSTVIDISENNIKILRVGAVKENDIQAIIS